MSLTDEYQLSQRLLKLVDSITISYKVVQKRLSKHVASCLTVKLMLGINLCDSRVLDRKAKFLDLKTWFFDIGIEKLGWYFN